MLNTVQRAVGLFENRRDAEAALTHLRDSGFDMNKVSVITKNPDTSSIQGAKVHSEKGNQVADAAGTGAVTGGIGGGAIGLLAGLGVLAIPGVGVAAELGVVLANTLLGGAIGAAGGGLIGALVGWGLPEDRARYYSDRIYEAGAYLILVEGATESIQTAAAVLRNYRVGDWHTFTPSEAQRSYTSSNTL